MLAETLSQAKQAEAERDLSIKKAQYQETVKKQQATADKAYEIQIQLMQQQVIAEAVKVQQVEKEQRDQGAGSRNPAPGKGADRHRAEACGNRDGSAFETLANAEKQRLITEAEGHASRHRAQGEAEADIIFKKGEAEAKAMNVKAEAYQEYNQAAVIDKLLTGLPEVVRALAAPLANVDKITIVSTGNGNTAGINKITGDITKMAAQVPALFETLSGFKISDLLSKIRILGDKEPPGNVKKQEE